jgi:anti-sigma B factor antagonist
LRTTQRPSANVQPFRVDVCRHGADVVVVLAGEIDVAAEPLISSTFRDLDDEGLGDVVVDLGEVTFIDSSGIRLILEAQQVQHRRGGRLVVVRPTDAVRYVITILGLDETFALPPTTPPARGRATNLSGR